jgi:hypothetical protein
LAVRGLVSPSTLRARWLTRLVCNLVAGQELVTCFAIWDVGWDEALRYLAASP